MLQEEENMHLAIQKDTAIRKMAIIKEEHYCSPPSISLEILMEAILMEKEEAIRKEAIRKEAIRKEKEETAIQRKAIQRKLCCSPPSISLPIQRKAIQRKTLCCSPPSISLLAIRKEAIRKEEAIPKVEVLCCSPPSISLAIQRKWEVLCCSPPSISLAIQRKWLCCSPPSISLAIQRKAIQRKEGLLCQKTYRPFRSSKYCASEHASSIYSGSDRYGTSGDPTNARMQKMCVLKQYDWIKEKLYWRDIISITDNLYSDGYLKHHELDKIQNRYQPRRKAADNLLKTVLRNPSAVSAFMRILESKSHLLYVAERINTTKISATGPDNLLSETCMKTSLDKQGVALGFVVSSLRIATVRQKLISHARKNLDLEFKEAVKGSSGILFVFSVVEPTQKLKHPFAAGPDIFAERMFQSYCDLDDQEPQPFEM